MMMTIGQVAKLAGVNKETIRYYEREGLIVRPLRQSSGYRQYPKATVTRILFIKSAQELSFSLKETKELLSLQDSDNASCLDANKLVMEKIATLEERIHDLQAIKSTLSQLVTGCNSRDTVTECPIIHYLNQREIEPTEKEAVE